MQSHGANRVEALAQLHGTKTPRVVQVKFRLPHGKPLHSVSINGKPAHASGEILSIHPGPQRTFTIQAEIV